MKLYDYKFLILFGLTFVIYFIYKEIEYLRNKILKIESSLLNNKIQMIDSKIENDLPNFNLPNFDLPKFDLPTFNFPTFTILPNSPKIITVDLTNNNNVVSESETDVSSKHVAIYSNDNDQHNDNSCSLLKEEE